MYIYIYVYTSPIVSGCIWLNYNNSLTWQLLKGCLLWGHFPYCPIYITIIPLTSLLDHWGCHGDINKIMGYFNNQL